jgi:sterol desaturase/sphingolipid hydroxylase (fatty acid hydroxylase superfamily)
MFQLPASLTVEVLRLTAWLALLMAIFLPLERAFGVRKKQRSFRKAFGADVALYYLNSIVPKLILVMPLSLIAGFVHYYVPAGIYSWIAGVPSWSRLLAALVVGEVGCYWGHRWSHEIPMLWRFHSIHHGALEIDWLVNTHAHPVDMIFTRLCGLVPMYLLGLAQPVANSIDLAPLIVTIAATIWGFFIHANLAWRFGPLEWIVASPAFHHWHHTNDGPELIDKNYAAMLPLVDKLFGTLHLPREWPARYGTETAVSPSLAGQLLQPFFSRDPRSAQLRPAPTE